MKVFVYILVLSVLVCLTLMAAIGANEHGVWQPLAIVIPLDALALYGYGRAVEESR